jgi:hypothetical protein
MHYVFKSRADADLIMMSGAGDQLLRIVGKEPAAAGIIELAVIPAAMRAIERAIAAENEAARHATEPREDDDSAVSVRVGLQQRAWPMLEMMKRSLAERSDIVWGV